MSPIGKDFITIDVGPTTSLSGDVQLIIRNMCNDIIITRIECQMHEDKWLLFLQIFLHTDDCWVFSPLLIQISIINE